MLADSQKKQAYTEAKAEYWTTWSYGLFLKGNKMTPKEEKNMNFHSKWLLIFCGLSVFYFSCQSGEQGDQSINYDKPIRNKLIQKGWDQSEKVQLFLRAFKEEERLECWVKWKGEEQYQLIEQYPFCSNSGGLGPKRVQGDRQIPEGFYWVDRYNPNSNFHLSLGINYPNASDLIFAHPDYPGSDIFIHGGCMTIGCISIGDPLIERLYELAEMARVPGHYVIQVHIFPNKFEGFRELLASAKTEDDRGLWRSLKPVFDYFEANKILPELGLNSSGYFEIIP